VPAGDDDRGQSGDVRPIPDPTTLTTDAVNQATRVAKDYADARIAVLVERLDGIDRATRLLNDTVTRVPTETQREVSHLRGLMEEWFRSVQTQFAERDTRSERESRDDKLALEAALKAQKEIAAKQDESNARAIEKSEKATEKNIDGISDKIDDLKDRVIAIEGRVVAIESGRLGAKENKAGVYAAIAAVGVFLGILVIAANFLAGS
jgi:hypothetical protein